MVIKSLKDWMNEWPRSTERLTQYVDCAVIKIIHDVAVLTCRQAQDGQLGLGGWVVQEAEINEYHTSAQGQRWGGVTAN